MTNNRWKNYNLWIAIFAFVPIFAESIGITSIIPQNYESLICSILAILVLAGIINNPTTTNRWLGDDN